jgi:hypothetical protein
MFRRKIIEEIIQKIKIYDKSTSKKWQYYGKSYGKIKYNRWEGY